MTEKKNESISNLIFTIGLLCVNVTLICVGVTSMVTRDSFSDATERGWFQYDKEYYKIEKIDNPLLEDEDGELFEVHRNKIEMGEKNE